MNDSKYPFCAKVHTQESISQIANRGIGFAIPEYQRPYDWSQDDIERLFYDALTSFARIDDDSTHLNASDYTFLGGVIVVRNPLGVNNFKGQVYDVVDGQQRITTLALIACSLSSKLRSYKSTLAKNMAGSPNFLDWINHEISTMIGGLDKCSIGRVEVGKTEHSFPKIVRTGESGIGDKRYTDPKKSIYVTPIGKFLNLFSEYVDDENTSCSGNEFQIPDLEIAGSSASKLENNYKTIQKLIESINKPRWYNGRDFDQFKMESIIEAKNRSLFNCLNTYFESNTEILTALNELAKLKDIEHIIRILLFSSYFHTRILLTLIRTDDELAAFDIFDSLNTTGQPITALETLKPRVVILENKHGMFGESESDLAYRKIGDNIDEKYELTSDKQSITRDLVISFGLYLNGTKVGRSLSLQRAYLTTEYKLVVKKGIEKARKFVTEIANLSEFRYHYFDCSFSDSQRAQFSDAPYIERAKLLSSFITGINTSMAIPLLFSYWKIKQGNIEKEEIFMDVLKAVTAFIVLRRAATGGTDGIDNDLRALMSHGKVPRTDLERGNSITRTLDRDALPANDLKSGLVQLLEKKLKGFDKDTWVEKVTQVPLYKASKPLVRFMIMIAADNAVPSDTLAGTWTKEDLREGGASRKYFEYDTWIGTQYRTVEHIAPEKPQPSGWDESLYADEDIRHKLGNLILLPAKENTALGNLGWNEKKLFYAAATLATKTELDEYIGEARKNGVKLPPKTENVLRSGKRLEILEPLVNLEKFDNEIVENRTKNIAELCWNFLRPWLDPTDEH